MSGVIPTLAALVFLHIGALWLGLRLDAWACRRKFRAAQKNNFSGRF